MINRQQIDSAPLESIYETIVPQDDLSDYGVAKFGHDPTGLGKLGYTINGLEDIDDKEAGILRGISGYKAGDGLQVF